MRVSWSFGISAVIRAAAMFACAHGMIITCSRYATAQEVEFKPRWDGMAKPKKQKQAEERQESSSVSTEDRGIYSFDRYADQLRQICNLLELDHRRERLSKAAFDEIRMGVPCKSCKAFLREVVEQCHYRRSIVPKFAVASTQRTVTPSADSATPTPSVSLAAPAAARYPLTEALDRVSSLSSTLYEKDGGDGSVFEAVRFFADLIMKQDNLSPAERDYYGIFTTYLLSAWYGRPNSPLESRAPLKEDIRSLFE